MKINRQYDPEKIKRCPCCNTTKKMGEFCRIQKYGKFYAQGYCRACMNEKCNPYKSYKQKYYFKNKQRVRVRAGLFKRVKNGSIIKKPCEVCKSDKSEAHHYLGYAPEHRIDVIWLCHKHHSALEYGLIS